MALALVLLVGSALLIRTSMALGAVNPGFDAENVLTMRMSLTGPQFAKSAAVDQLMRDGVERLRALPGVVIASATCCVPLEGGYGLPFIVMGRPLTDGPFHGGGGWQTVSPGYFEVFKIPVLRGRAFTDRDDGAVAPGGGDQPGDGATVLAEGRSAERPDLDRQGRDAAVRRRKRRGRSSASSATSAATG